MSYATGAVLDGLDPQLQAIQAKLFTGKPLTRQESARLMQRKSVEEETVRTGGTVKESVFGPGQGQAPQMAAAPLTAEQAGSRDAKQAMDYIRGRDAAMNAGQEPKMSPTGQPMTRRSTLTNAATLEEKQADNALGPHLGADGLPATWKVPTAVTSREGFARADDSSGPSSTRMMGADGNWKVWKDGKFQAEEQPRTATTTARVLGAAANGLWQGDYRLPPSLTETVGNAVGEFVGNRLPGVDARPSVSPVQAAASAWMGKGGSQFSGVGYSGGVKTGVQNQPPSSLPSAEAVAAASVPTPMGATAQSAFEGAIRQPVPPAVNLNPVPPPATPEGDEAAKKKPFSIYSLAPGVEVPSKRQGPMFPNAIWNTPPNFYDRSGPFQATAERFNPFSDRRRTSVLPE